MTDDAPDPAQEPPTDDSSTDAAPATSDDSPSDPSTPAAEQTTKTQITRRRPIGRLRAPIARWQSIPLGLLSIALVLGIWWVVTLGESGEDRIISPAKLPSLEETFSTFESLWFERALTRNTYASLRRVVLGFGLAVIVGVPSTLR